MTPVPATVVSSPDATLRKLTTWSLCVWRRRKEGAERVGVRRRCCCSGAVERRPDAPRPPLTMSATATVPSSGLNATYCGSNRSTAVPRAPASGPRPTPAIEDAYHGGGGGEGDAVAVGDGVPVADAVADGDAVDDGDALPDAEAVPLCDGVTEADGVPDSDPVLDDEAVPLADGVDDTDAVPDADAVPLSDADRVGDGVRVVVCDGRGVGVGLAVDSVWTARSRR